MIYRSKIVFKLQWNLIADDYVDTFLNNVQGCPDLKKNRDTSNNLIILKKNVVFF